MKRKLRGTDVLMLCILILLLISAIPGVSSFATNTSYEITNQYGDSVRIYGNGIYAHDSYNKATIAIGTDFTMLILVVPMFIYAIVSEMKNRTVKSKLFLISVLATVLYYAASLSFGVTYNSLHLIYIELFSSALFGLILLFRRIGLVKLRTKQAWELPSTGVTIF
ncbi:hypothetical protein [Bacillus sp. T3]|uniref:hypothetical protein n=1 Tax=Bacillus sp. T3 TaxID=467262 RepID=UPI0029819A1E|nr:hypothetical protein [Bacillus sp. T3]